MEIREFAEQVLLSGDLTQKLFAPERFSDEAPGSPLAPATPGRPAFLPLVPTRPIPTPPTPQTLADPTARGLALHTFAHHELLALELMALALLRFPDAPAGFRLGLAHIIKDEQRHFRLYRERAEHWGVELGDVGVGHFFWDTVAPLDTPTAFLAALSLTYEQANIDFARYWKEAFAAVDDHASADVLATVYEDELRHVAHGVRWFERLAGGIDYATYAQALVFPLSPGRAKGPIFDREGRLRAGLPEAFVDELELRNVSRGRPPWVFSFDPFVEEQVAGRTPKANVLAVARDLASLPLFLARREDVVIAPRPSLPTLRRLHAAGFEVPQFVDDLPALGDRELAGHRPWGWSPTVAQALGQPWDPAHATLYDKTWAFAQRAAFGATDDPLLAPIEGGVCRTLAEVEALLTPGRTWIAKASLSSSGQHRTLLDAPIADAARRWLERTLARGPVVVEPWYERVADVSVQVEVGPDQTRVVGLTRFWTAATGAYRGALVDDWQRGLPPEVARFAHGGGRGSAVTSALKKAAHHVAEEARALGYTGPLGVDAMLVRLGPDLKLVPILEVNPRFTMGRVALGLRERCAGRGCWLFLQRSEVEDLAAFVAAVEVLPLEVHGAAGRLRRGAVFTTDPHTATRVLTLLVVGRTQQEAAESLSALGLAGPA